MFIESLELNEVFVFGSHANGAHGGGAARTAYEKFGAVLGEAHGLLSQIYAIDTKRGLVEMAKEATAFLKFASEHPELRFLVSEIGCGIAGCTVSQVAPLYTGAAGNVVLSVSLAAF